MILFLALLLMQAPASQPKPPGSPGQPKSQASAPSPGAPSPSDNQRPAMPPPYRSPAAHPVILVPSVNGKCTNHDIKLTAEDKTVWCLRP